MSDPKSARKFEYRPSRKKAGFGVDFLVGQVTFHGICRDFSDAGVRAEFDGNLEIGHAGVLVLRHPSGLLSIEAQVAYVEKGEAGLVFLFKTPLERTMTTQFISEIANYSALCRP